MPDNNLTEDQVYQTLGRSKVPYFKQKEREKPVEKPMLVKVIPSPEVDEFEKKLIEELNELNARVNEIQKTIKSYMILLFFVIIVMSLAMLAGLVLKV